MIFDAFLAAAMVPIIVLVHELGHALAGRALGLGVSHFTVGTGGGLSIRAGSLRVHLSADMSRAGPSGFVRFDGVEDARRFVVAVAAGPAASLVGAVVTGVLALEATEWRQVLLGAYTLSGLVAGLGSLRPTGHPETGDASDGMLIACVWRLLHERPLPPRPSVGPPLPAASPSAPAPPAVRPVFALLGLAVLGLALATDPALAVALAVLGGGAYLSGNRI